MWQIRGLKCSAEDGDGMILRSDIVEGFRPAVLWSVLPCFFSRLVPTYYFSTHG